MFGYWRDTWASGCGFVSGCDQRTDPLLLNVKICGPDRFGEETLRLLFFAPGLKPVFAHLNPPLEIDALISMQNKCFHGRQRKWEKPGRISIERTLDIWENVKENKGADGGMRILISCSSGLSPLRLLISDKSYEIQPKESLGREAEPLDPVENSGLCRNRQLLRLCCAGYRKEPKQGFRQMAPRAESPSAKLQMRARAGRQGRRKQMAYLNTTIRSETWVLGVNVNENTYFNYSCIFKYFKLIYIWNRNIWQLICKERLICVCSPGKLDMESCIHAHPCEVEQGLSLPPRHLRHRFYCSSPSHWNRVKYKCEQRNNFHSIWFRCL